MSRREAIFIIFLIILIISVFTYYTGLIPSGERPGKEAIIKSLLSGVPKGLTVTSEDFSEGGFIGRVFTCDGDNINPSIRWIGVTGDIKSIAIIIYDVDAPGDYFIHWIVYNIPVNINSIPRNISGRLGFGVEGRNDFGSIGYGGPCPPPGDKPHRYVVVVLGLDIILDAGEGIDIYEFYDLASGHIVIYGETSFNYSR